MVYKYTVFLVLVARAVNEELQEGHVCPVSELVAERSPLCVILEKQWHIAAATNCVPGVNRH